MAVVLFLLPPLGAAGISSCTSRQGPAGHSLSLHRVCRYYYGANRSADKTDVAVTWQKIKNNQLGIERCWVPPAVTNCKRTLAPKHHLWKPGLKVKCSPFFSPFSPSEHVDNMKCSQDSHRLLAPLLLLPSAAHVPFPPAKTGLGGQWGTGNHFVTPSST